MKKRTFLWPLVWVWGGVVVAVAVLVIIVGMAVVIRKAHKQTKEAPFHDYVASHQSPPLPERI